MFIFDICMAESERKREREHEWASECVLFAFVPLKSLPENKTSYISHIWRLNGARCFSCEWRRVRYVGGANNDSKRYRRPGTLLVYVCECVSVCVRQTFLCLLFAAMENVCYSMNFCLSSSFSSSFFSVLLLYANSVTIIDWNKTCNTLIWSIYIYFVCVYGFICTFVH